MGPNGATVLLDHDTGSLQTGRQDQVRGELTSSQNKDNVKKHGAPAVRTAGALIFLSVGCSVVYCSEAEPLRPLIAFSHRLPQRSTLQETD